MKTSHMASMALLAASASAQLLSKGIGSLPSCASSCTILTTVQQSCGSNWQCFCSRVWTQSQQSPATACSASCTNPQDNTAVGTWYTTNCGSDNGVSEHSNARTGGTGTGTGTGTGAGNGAGSGTAASASASASANALAGQSTDTGCASWWDCHWQWIVMVIVLALALIALGFGGRWLKKRHDRKKDQITGGFNSGITTRTEPITNDKVRDSSIIGASTLEAGSGRNTPSRSRDAFMPYGYGYTRSESALGGTARGGTPANELEKGNPEAASGTRNKLRRAMGR